MAHSIFSLKKMTKGSLAAAYSHDARTMEVKNADGTLTELNKDLIDSYGRSYGSLAENRIKQFRNKDERAIRKDAVYAFSVVLALPKEKADSVDVEAWSKKSIEWLEKTFNRDAEKYGSNLVSAKLHMDESSPHIHALIVPLDEKGHLNAYEYVHGPGSLRQMQTSYAKDMAEFGLERGKEYSVAKHQDLKKFYSVLNEAIETKAPEIKQGESIEEYKSRCDKSMSNLAMQVLGKAGEIDKAINDGISEEHKKTVETKMELKNAHKTIKELNKEVASLKDQLSEKDNEKIRDMAGAYDEIKNLKKYKEEAEEMEHTLGAPMTEIVEKVIAMDAIKESIDSIEDPVEKEQTRKLLNDLIRKGKDEKKKKKLLEMPK